MKNIINFIETNKYTILFLGLISFSFMFGIIATQYKEYSRVLNSIILKQEIIIKHSLLKEKRYREYITRMHLWQTLTTEKERKEYIKKRNNETRFKKL